MESFSFSSLTTKGNNNASRNFMSSTAFIDGDKVWVILRFQGNWVPYDGNDNGTKDSKKVNYIWFVKDSYSNLIDSLQEVEGKKMVYICLRTLENGLKHPYFSIQTFKTSRMIAEWTTGGLNFFSYKKTMKEEKLVRKLGSIDYEKFINVILAESKHMSYDSDSYNCEHWMRSICKRVGVPDTELKKLPTSISQVKENSLMSKSVSLSFFTFRSYK